MDRPFLWEAHLLAGTSTADADKYYDMGLYWDTDWRSLLRQDSGPQVPPEGQGSGKEGE